MNNSDTVEQPVRLYTQDFEQCLEKVYEVEGGYSDHPEDKGGKTKYGITENILLAWIELTGIEHIGVEHINKSQAKEIYFDLYWQKIRGNELPDGLDLMVFDHCIHAGQGIAIMHMQKAIGTLADGIIGPMTIGAIKSMGEGDVLKAIHNISVGRLVIAKNSPTFFLGWFNRIVNICIWSTQRLVGSGPNTKVG